MQTIKLVFNYFRIFVTLQHRGLHHLDLYCTLIIQAWRKSNIHFDCRNLELLNACKPSLVFIALNVRGETESKYPSFFWVLFTLLLWLSRLVWALHEDKPWGYKLFLAQLNWAWSFNSHKTKLLKNTDCSCFQTLDVAFNMLINVKMPTITC